MKFHPQGCYEHRLFYAGFCCMFFVVSLPQLSMVIDSTKLPKELVHFIVRK